MPFTPYFRKAIRKGVSAVHTEHFGRVAFRALGVKRAKELWEQGFPHLELTREGAQHLYGDLNAAQRTELLKKCRTPEEVAAVVALTKQPSKALKEAAEKRLQEVAPPDTTGR